MKRLLLRLCLSFGIVKRSLKLECIQYNEYEKGYSEPSTITKQYFAKYTYWFGFISIREKVIEETVPSFAWMQKCALGYTDWKSSIPTHLFRYAKKNIQKA